MDAPSPGNPVVALAAFVRQRLAEMTESLGTLASWSRRDEAGVLPARSGDNALATARRQLAMVIVGAAAPFAPTSHARVRLLRQMHASGLLTEKETEQAVTALGAPR